MRVFAISDVHIDFAENRRWITELSQIDYTDDVLILAGDITDSLQQLEWCLQALASRFKAVHYVPGNHELWVMRNKGISHSLEKFTQVCDIAQNCQVQMQPSHYGPLSIVPLFAWYDYSFGSPSDELLACWMDYRACKWPDGWNPDDVTRHFLALNEQALQTENQTVISFSHFLPRIDLMPSFIPANKRFIYPVLGTSELEKQIRKINPQIHVYGHSHVNRSIEIEDVLYVNNAFGYPMETRITAKRLISIFEN